jgi:hypothetical protein
MSTGLQKAKMLDFKYREIKNITDSEMINRFDFHQPRHVDGAYKDFLILRLSSLRRIAPYALSLLGASLVIRNPSKPESRFACEN